MLTKNRTSVQITKMYIKIIENHFSTFPIRLILSFHKMKLCQFESNQPFLVDVRSLTQFKSSFCISSLNYHLLNQNWFDTETPETPFCKGKKIIFPGIVCQQQQTKRQIEIRISCYCRLCRLFIYSY